MNEKLPGPQEILTDSVEMAEEPKVKRGKGRSRGPIGTVAVLVVSAVLAVLAAYVWLPVFQIYGSSMNPTLMDGDIVVAVKTANVETGDIIAFTVNNKLLVKRVIGIGGDEIHVAPNGTVSVNNRELKEPYVTEKHDGDPDIIFPLWVPDNSCFVIGDNRSGSVDSRHTAVGCVEGEQIVGKLVFRVWPMSGFGFVD